MHYFGAGPGHNKGSRNITGKRKKQRGETQQVTKDGEYTTRGRSHTGWTCHENQEKRGVKPVTKQKKKTKKSQKKELQTGSNTKAGTTGIKHHERRGEGLVGVLLGGGRAYDSCSPWVVRDLRSQYFHVASGGRLSEPQLGALRRGSYSFVLLCRTEPSASDADGGGAMSWPTTHLFAKRLVQLNMSAPSRCFFLLQLSSGAGRARGRTSRRPPYPTLYRSILYYTRHTIQFTVHTLCDTLNCTLRCALYYTLHYMQYYTLCYTSRTI